MTRRVRNAGINDVQRRIRDLERRLAELDERLTKLETPPEKKLWQILKEQEPRPKRGRKAKYPFHIEGTRNALLELFEEFWPEFDLLFRRPDRPADIRALLKAFHKRPPLGRYRAAVDHLLENLDTLLVVLKSNRYRSNPRSLANSLAGVPHVSWWRSMKVCAERGYPSLLGDRVLKSYVERKYPHIARVFNEAKNEFELAVRTKGMRTKDAEISRLFSSADYAWRVWQSGRANFATFTDSHFRKLRKS